MKSIELFAGAGGLGMGASRAGIEPLLVVERDRWCCDTLRENRASIDSPIHGWPDPFEGDIQGVDFRPFEGRIDVVTGGPPCQPFSLGGRHRSHRDHRDMWSESVRAVRETRPKAFIFENVKGLTRQAFATYLGYVLLQLQHPSIARRPDEAWDDHLRRLQRHHTGLDAAEYRIVLQVVNAADYGVPQRRERVVFVGFRADVKAEWSFPAPTHSQDALLFDQFSSGDYWGRHRVPMEARAVGEKAAERGRKLVARQAGHAWLTVRDAIAGLPDPEREISGVLNHRFQPGARSYPGHTGSPMDEPAKTLKAGVHGVPGGENMMRRANGSVRYFTVRESARLQTFPDGYVLHGAWSEAMRQLGNAVPVALAEVIARSVRAHLLS